jgi:hypothetical protein
MTLNVASIVFLFLALAAGFASTYWLTLWLEPVTGKNTGLEDLRQSVYAEISKMIDKHGFGATEPVDFPQLRERLWQMIQYAIGRHDYYERVRRDFLTIGLGLVGAATALEAILLKPGESPARSWFLIVGGIVLALTGLALVFRYVYETSPDYPYRNLADIRSWYHHYNLSGKNSFSVRSGTETVQANQESTRDQLMKFAETWLLWASPKTFNVSFVAEDLEQVFILYLLQQYKRVFARKMGIVLAVGATVFILCLVANLVVVIIPWISPYLWSLCAGAIFGALFGATVQYL